MTNAGSLLAAAREVPHQVALIWDGVPWSFAELWARVAAICHRLDERGLGPGARVVFDAPLGRETLLLVHALLARGDTLIPVHPRWTAAERARLCNDTAPDLILEEKEVRSLARGDADGDPTRLRSRPTLDAPAAILFTSGTTGRPRGALLSRAALSASAAASAAALPWRPDDRWLLGLPLAHVGGLSIVTRCLAARRPVVGLTADRFDPAAVLQALRRDRVTRISLVPTMLDAVLDADDASALTTLRAALLGGAPAPRPLLARAAAAGVAVLTTYGLTEACSQVTLQRPGEGGADDSGRALPGVDLCVARDDGAPCGPGEVGRILVRGPQLFDGYLGEPPRARDEPFDTGDLGALDPSGALHVAARRTDLIVSGGENVYPAEVEAALLGIDGVAAAAVVGLVDERWGQRVAAALVLAAGASPGTLLDRIAASLASRLAHFKRPRSYRVVAALPVTAAGKLDRAATVRLLAAPAPP